MFDCAVLCMHPQTTVRPTSCQRQTLKVCVCVRLCAHVCERHSGSPSLLGGTFYFFNCGLSISGDRSVSTGLVKNISVFCTW